MRATDRWAIERARHPRRSSSWSAPARGWPRSSASSRSATGRSRSSAARATTAATATSPRGCCARPGREVTVLAAAPVEELEGDARTQRRAPAGRRRPSRSRPRALEPCALAVDALLGTGFDGRAARRRRPRRSRRSNASGGAVVACDVPSGVDASTRRGRRARPCSALATATFDAAKPGLWINPGKAHAGQRARHRHRHPARRAGRAARRRPDRRRGAAGAASRARRAGWTKFTSGHVLVAGGSRGLTGAPCLAAEAAPARRRGLRHRVRARRASRRSSRRACSRSMTRGLPDDDGAHTDGGRRRGARAGAARRRARRSGPGLGRTDGALAFARALVREAEVAGRARRRRPQRPRRRPRGARRAAPRRRSSRPTRASSGACSDIDSDEVKARRLHHAREAAAARGRDRRAQGRRHARRRARRPRRRQPGRKRRAGDRGDRRRAQRRHRRAARARASTRSPPRAPACACTRGRACTPRDAHGVDGVIARDVIEALPHAW